METYRITPNLTLLDLQPPTLGYKRFIGAYLLRSEKNAIIDVGPKAAIPNLLSALSELGMSPKEVDYIILTHIHIDHAGGAGTAIREMDRAKVLAHSRARRHLIDPTTLWENSQKTLGKLAIQYGDIESVPENRILDCEDLMKLNLGRGLVLEVYLTPGHAPHHLSLFDRASGVLIAGEAAGVCLGGAIRPATPPPFKLEDALSSIDRLIGLEPKLLCYGHFGCYDNAPERLRAIRQKLLDWYEIVTAAAKAGKDPEEMLAILKRKDSGLRYLNNLPRDESNREHDLIINTIKGLSQAVRKSG